MSLYVCIIFVLLGFVAGFLIGWRIGIPYISVQGTFSIGILSGNSPFALKSEQRSMNPVLTASDVTDVKAEFIADPFMIREDSKYFMFFEVFNTLAKKGEIGLARSSDGFRWNYDRIVLNESFHLSYPHVFEWQHRYYMIPESASIYAVRLYEASDFPHCWVFVKNLLVGSFFDSSLIYYDMRWWLFTSDRNDVLRVFSTKDLLEDWSEHPKSPIIVGNARIARNAGRIILSDGYPVRFAQDCADTYGKHISAFRITQLTVDHYDETSVANNPILKPSANGWNSNKMHHLDAHQLSGDYWLACADGVRRRIKFGWKKSRPLFTSY